MSPQVLDECIFSWTEDTIDMTINFLKILNGAPKDAFKTLIVTSDQEILAVFDNVCEVVVRGISHVCEIYRRRAICSCGINHVAECGILVAFSAGLDHKVGEPPVKNGIESVDVNLVKATR